MSQGDGKIGNKALWLTVSNFIVALIGVISSMLLSRFRSLEEYGTYSQVIMVTDLVSTVLLMGLPSTVSYFLSKAETEEEKQSFFSTYTLLSLFMTAVIGVCLYLATPLIVSYFDNPYISTFAYIFALYPWSSIMLNTVSGVLVVYNKTARLVAFNLIHVFVTLLIIILSVIFKISFEIYAVVYILSTLLFALVGLYMSLRLTHGIKLSLSKKLIREIFAFALPMGLASSVGTLNTELDKLIIGKFFSAEEYALFTNAARALPVTVLATALVTMITPIIVRLLREEQNERAAELWRCATKISIAVMSLIVGGLIVFAPDVMTLFYSEKYVTQDSVAVFRIYSLILMLRVTYFGLILNCMGKTKFILYSSLISLGLNLIGNIGFYYLLGFIGPAIATLLSVVAMNFAQLYVTSKQTNVPFRRIYPWGTLIMYCLQTALIGSLTYFIRYCLLGDINGVIGIITSIGLGIIWTGVHFTIQGKNVKLCWIKLNQKNIDEGEEYLGKAKDEKEKA